MLVDQKSVLLLNSVVFSVIGLLFLLLPAQMANVVTDTAPDTPSGLIDMRATYGGVLLGCGVTLFVACKSSETRRCGLIMLVIVLGGMATGRILGILLDGRANALMYLFLAYEFFFIGLALHVMRIRNNNTNQR